MIWLVPHDRISVCVVEQAVDASVPQIREPVTQGHHSRALATASSGADRRRVRSSNLGGRHSTRAGAEPHRGANRGHVRFTDSGEIR